MLSVVESQDPNRTKAGPGHGGHLTTSWVDMCGPQKKSDPYLCKFCGKFWEVLFFLKGVFISAKIKIFGPLLVQIQKF